MPVTTSVNTSGLGALLSFPVMLFSLIVFVAVIAGLWAMFDKAGRPGWAAIIPIYDVYVMLKIAGMSGWWLLAFLVPILNFIIGLVLLWKLSKAFGHGFWMWLGFIFLSFIFYPVVGFGSSQYMLPKYERHRGETTGTMPTPA